MGEEVASFPRDFLRRFGVAANSCGINASVEETEVGGGGRGGKGHFEDVELSLGLSLGGCFGAKPKQERLARSSSTAALPADHELPFVAPPLARTCSLPAETEEMLRKRKQLQSLKRSEAKRKRLERKKSSIPAAPAAKDANNDSGTENGRIKGLANSNRSLPPALPPWSMRIGRPRAQKVGGSNSCLPRAAPQAPVTSQGSISSGVSDDNLQNPTNKQGYVASESKENLEVRSQSKMSEQSNGSAATKHPSASVPGTGEHNGGGGGGGAKKEAVATKNANGNGNGLTKAAGRSIMESMPCVSTRGSGPNGRRIEGFLYKYRKGEEVRIVCVCHGSSLTPAEFVKHAGGGDVVNPLKHIVVSPSPMAML